jgi:hypothetical protein
MSTKVAPLRNELFVRLSDLQLAWLDQCRGEEPRSTFVRKLIQREAVKALVEGGRDAPAA